MRDSARHKAATIRWRQEHSERHLETQRRYRRNVPAAESYSRNRVQWLRKRYGLTPEQVEAQLASQGGCCAICHKPLDLACRKTHVDHCHATGRFRGVLCHGCNVKLAPLENVEWRARAEAYLRRT